MATNPYVNKVISNAQTLIDLTADTVAPADVRAGVTFHDMSGAACVGTASAGGGGFDWSQINGIKFLNPMVNSTIDLDGMDTSTWTIFDGVFSNCYRYTSIDVSDLDTSNATSMSSMFESCSGLQSLDLSNFNTEKVLTMSSMFRYCEHLQSLDLSSFDTSNVMNMMSMFYRCLQITSLDLSNFVTSNVTSMASMFEQCTHLQSIDVSSFNTEKVTNMYRMFSTTNTAPLDLYSFDTSNVTNMSQMFEYSGKPINLASFNTEKVTNMSGMFRYTDLATHVIWCTRQATVQPLCTTPSDAGINGRISFYVSDALLNDYKAATNWSTIASQIHPISELPSNVAELFAGHY